MPDDFATALAKSKAPKAPPAFGEALAMARGGSSEPKIEDVRGAIFGNAGTDDALPFSDNEKVDYVKRLFPGQDVDPGSEVLSPDEQQRIYAGYKREPYVVGASAGDPEFTRRTSVAAFDKLFGPVTLKDRQRVEEATKKHEASFGEKSAYVADRLPAGMFAPALGLARTLNEKMAAGNPELRARMDAASLAAADPTVARVGSARAAEIRADLEKTFGGRTAVGAAEFLGATPGLIAGSQVLGKAVGSTLAGPAALGLQGFTSSGGDLEKAGEGVAFGAIAGALSVPLKAYISRLPAVVRSAAVDRLATMAAGGTEFAVADAILNGPDGERALTNFIFGAGMKAVGETPGQARVKDLTTSREVYPNPVEAALGVREVYDRRLAEVESARPATPAIDPVAEAKATAAEFDARPAPEPTAPEKPVSVAPVAPDAPASKTLVGTDKRGREVWEVRGNFYVRTPGGRLGAAHPQDVAEAKASAQPAAIEPRVEAPTAEVVKRPSVLDALERAGYPGAKEAREAIDAFPESKARWDPVRKEWTDKPVEFTEVEARPMDAAPKAPAETSAAPVTAEMLYHGSPRTDLRVVQANPQSRQYDNATSQLGAFFSPSEGEASRYAGKSGRVYAANVQLSRPYEMSWSEFNKFQSPDKGPDGKTIADFSESGLARRTEELKSEAASLRRDLESQGYDGVIVRSGRGRVLEVASFKDVPLPEPAPAEAPRATPKAKPAPVEAPKPVAEVPTVRLLHGSRTLDLESLQPGSMLTSSREWASGYVDPNPTGGPTKSNRARGVVYEADVPVGKTRRFSNLHDAEGWMVDYAAELLGRQPKSLREAADVVHEATKYSALVVKNESGVVTDAIVLSPEGARVVPAPGSPRPTAAPVEAPKPKPAEPTPPPVEAPRPEGVSIKNAAVEADRAARGAEPLPETKPEKMADWKDEAIRRVEENPNYPVELIERLKRTGSPHDKVEAAALTVHRVKLNESLAKAEADVLKAAERGDMDGVKEAKIRADNLRAQDYEVSELVGKAAGAEAARALGARAMALDHQYELLPMETRLRVENNGAPLSEAQKAETKAIHDEMAALRKKVADYEARKGGKIELLEGKRPDVPKVSVADVKGAEYGRRNTIVTREAYDATRAALRDKLSRMSANPFLDPSMIGDLAKIGAFHVEAGARSFASWSKAMVSDLGDKVTPHLREIWRAAQIEMGEPGQGDAKRLAALKSRLRTRIADREARMAMGKMENAPKREPVKRDAEAIRLEAERDMIERKWQRTLMAAAWKQKSMAQKAGALAISGTRNLSRALMTAWDFSAPLRQGAILTASHPIKAAKAMGAMFRAFRSPEHQAMIEAEMRLDPKYGEAKRAGLFLSEHSDSAVAKMEENLVSGWIEKIPGVGASQRAYTTFLNKLRFDVFKGGLENLSAAKDATPAEARAWANFINVATGRGGPQGSPKMDAAFNALNNAFFAPRLAYSRFQVLLGTPMWRGTAASRKMIAMEYARSMTGLAIVYGLAQLVGGKIEKDGKVRFGNSVLDPTAGLASASKLLQQTVPGMAKAVTGAKRENQGFGRGDEVTAIGRYLRGKLAPLPGSALNLMSGKDPVGKPVTLGSEAVNLTTPMSYRDIYLAMKEHGVPKGAALGVLALFGMGLQNYRKKGG